MTTTTRKPKTRACKPAPASTRVLDALADALATHLRQQLAAEQLGLRPVKVRAGALAL